MNKLSPRQLEFVQIYITKWNMRETAEVMGIRTESARSHKNEVLNKTGSHSIGEALFKLKEAGII